VELQEAQKLFPQVSEARIVSHDRSALELVNVRGQSVRNEKLGQFVNGSSVSTHESSESKVAPVMTAVVEENATESTPEL